MLLSEPLFAHIADSIVFLKDPLLSHSPASRTTKLTLARPPGLPLDMELSVAPCSPSGQPSLPSILLHSLTLSRYAAPVLPPQHRLSITISLGIIPDVNLLPRLPAGSLLGLLLTQLGLPIHPACSHSHPHYRLLVSFIRRCPLCLHYGSYHSLLHSCPPQT